MTTQKIAQHPSPTCPCEDCIVEFVKDWEYDDGIVYPIDKPNYNPIWHDYYSDEYTGPFQNNISRYDDWN